MKEIKKSASLKSKVKGKETPFNIDLNYSKEYDSFIIKVKKGEGIMSYTDTLQGLPLEVVQKLNEMLEEVLIKAGSKYEMKEHKMMAGGDFQAGVYAEGGKTSLREGSLQKYFKYYPKCKELSLQIEETLGDKLTDKVAPKIIKLADTYTYESPNKYAEGGSLQAHGIEVGDTFMTTISGTIQKVKDKNGKIVYINLANGERDTQPPLPFDEGGEVTYFLNKDGIKVSSKAEPQKKLTEAEWMEKHNDSKEARSYGFGGMFSKTINRPKPIDLNQKQVILKSGEYVQVLNQNGNTLMVIELSKLGTGASPKMVKLSDVDMTSFATGGALVGNQKRIDMNKNGKIDAEDFKLLRSSMNGAWRNERKHVNHNEDYEVRYAKKKPSRTGYKGKRKFGEGGGISNFERLSRVVAKNYEGKRVKPQYQKEYGKTYSKAEAKEVGNKVAGKMKMMKKAESGAEVKKGNRGGVMVLAKKIRKEGESWRDALKRAGQQLK
jgi:hypothetical protein